MLARVKRFIAGNYCNFSIWYDRLSAVAVGCKDQDRRVRRMVRYGEEEVEMMDMDYGCDLGRRGEKEEFDV